MNTSKTEGKLLTYITTSNVYWDRFVLNELKSMHFTDDEISKCTVCKGDLLVCEGGDIGRAAIWDSDEEIRIQNHLHRLRAYDSINVKFYYYVLYLYKLTGRINGQGIGLQGLSSNALHSLIVPLPPVEEQERIVNKLDLILVNLESLNKKKEELEETIESVKSKILDLAIRGKLVPQNPEDEPASVLLERIRAEKEELIKQGKIKRDKNESVIFKGDDNSYYAKSEKNCVEVTERIQFEIPENWSWTTLGFYCQKVTDQVASGSFAALKENVPSLKTPDYALMVKTADFANGFSDNLTYTTKHGYDFLQNSNLFGGELIMSNIGSIGKVFIVPHLNKKMTLAPNSIMLRFTDEIYKDYFYYFLKSSFAYSELMAITSGNGVVKFNKTGLKTIIVPIPPLEEQNRIVEAIENSFAVLDSI